MKDLLTSSSSNFVLDEKKMLNGQDNNVNEVMRWRWLEKKRGEIEGGWENKMARNGRGGRERKPKSLIDDVECWCGSILNDVECWCVS